MNSSITNGSSVDKSSLQAKIPLALGCMGLSGTWNPAEVGPAHERRAIAAYEAALIAGITLFDHADIYGGGSCETVFKSCLKAFPESREAIQIWSKGGIRSGYFDFSADYLTKCIEDSRQRLGIDTIDLYQLHRPDPLTHPSETADALNKALKAGHIRAVGVSNFFPEQTRALQKYLDVPIISNQFEFNALRVSFLYEGWEAPAYGGYSQGTGSVGDGLLDFCMANDITPLAYSPLARSVLSKSDATDGITRDVQDVIGELALKYDATRTQIALAWLWTHPAGVIPVVGSNNPAHIFEAAQRHDLRLEREEWYRIWKAAWNRNLP
jgi:predicted oxidoreductase